MMESYKVVLFAVALGISGIASADGQEAKIIRVTSILSEPFLMLKEGSHKGNDRFEGFIKDMLEDMSSIIPNFNYTLHLSRDGKYGSLNQDGKWNGMIGELVNGETDMVAADLTANYMRSQAVDFTTPYMSYGLVMLMNKRDVTYGERKSRMDIFFLLPFSSSVWVCLIVAMVVVTILFYVINRFNPYEERSHKQTSGDVNSGVLGSLWFVCGGLALQGYSKRPRSAAAFILSAFWWFFAIIILATYIMGMVSMQARSMFFLPGLKVRALGDALKQPNITIGCIAGGSTMTFFKDSRIPVYQKTWEKMANGPEDRKPFVRSTQEGINRSEAGGYAFVGESPMIDFVVRRRCNLVRVGGYLDEKSYAFASPRGSLYRDIISKVLLRLREDGKMTLLKTKWWEGDTGCPDEFEVLPSMFHPSDSPEFRPRDAVDISIAMCHFLFLLIGVCIAVVTFVIEFLVFRARRQRPAADGSKE